MKMTKQSKTQGLILIVTVFILTAILLFPVVAFAESEANSDTESIESSSPSVSESSLDNCTTSSNTETSLSNSAGETSTENPSLEPSFESTSADLETADEEPVDPVSEGGDCYVATITPDAVVDDDATIYTDGTGSTIPNTGDSATFTVTFTEVGNQTLGSAQIKIKYDFTITDPILDTDTISASNGKQWEGIIEGDFVDGWVLKLWAASSGDYLTEGESVSASFSATTPAVRGVYYFETAAWTEANATFDGVSGDPAKINNMAMGYSDPVVIVGLPVATAEDLNTTVRSGLADHYVQVADIDLKDYSDSEGWDPIGDPDLDYLTSGSFNGNGYTIGNLFINRPEEPYVGLFAGIEADCVLYNVRLEDVDVTGGYSTGGLAGLNRSDKVINCYVSGMVKGTNVVGGLLGFNLGTLANCSFNGEVEGNDNVGGLVGYQKRLSDPSSDIYYPGTTINCFSDGTVTGNSKVGGLVGTNENGIVSGCHSSTAVTGNDSVGGLVGQNWGTPTLPAAITKSYTNGTVTGVSDIGGLVGLNAYGSIEDCYSTATVTGIDGEDEGNTIRSYRIGGFTGAHIWGTITDCYATGDVEGYWYVGGFVGHAYQGGSSNPEITNCFAIGNVEGYSNVGGFAGANDHNSNISDCYALGSVSGIVEDYTGNYIGGFAGTNNGTITRCYAEGAVTGNESIGGLIGGNGGSVTTCYASGNTTGTYGVGGLVGYAQSGSIENCYALGDVQSKMAVGGLVGANQSEVINCYALGNVTVIAEDGNANSGKVAGGLVGQSNSSGNISGCFAAGNVHGPAEGEYLATLVGYNSGAITNCFAAGAVNGEITTLINFNEGTLTNVGPITVEELWDIDTYQTGSATGWNWLIFNTDVETIIGTYDPYPYPRLFWENDQFNESYIWFINSEGSGSGDNGNGNGGDNGESPGDDLDDFDWSTGIPTDSLWPGGGTPAWARILLFRDRSGPRSVFSVNFIINGTRADLLKAITAYNQALLKFEQNKENMNEAEYAVAVIELAVARAAIMIVEARLSGDPDALAAAIEAYELAMEQLTIYGSFLSESQASIVASLMDAIESVIAALSN